MEHPAHLRQAQEQALSTAFLGLDIVPMLREAGAAHIQLFRKLGFEFDPATFLVTYLTSLCGANDLDGPLMIETFQITGVFERLADELAALQAETA